MTRLNSSAPSGETIAPPPTAAVAKVSCLENSRRSPVIGHSAEERVGARVSTPVESEPSSETRAGAIPFA